MAQTDDFELRAAPRGPAIYLWVGLGLAIVGALLAAADDGQVPGVIVLAIAGVVTSIGVIGLGVLVGMRVVNHEAYLHRLIDAGAESDDE